MGSPSGPIVQVTGFAQNTSEVGQFVLTLNTTSHPGYYWVIAYGQPSGNSTQYPWGVVSSPFRSTLFILARNVDDFYANYNDQVLALVERKNFTSAFNKPLQTYQGSDCAYAYPVNKTTSKSKSLINF